MPTNSIKTILCLLMCNMVYADVDELFSSRRDLDKDYSFYEERALEKTIVEREGGNFRSALRSAKKWKELEIPEVTGWKESELQQRFEAIRDRKFLESPNGGELRRASWLYPDDGCFARAALAVKSAFELFMPVPMKVFAFGNLGIKTPNSPRGRVGWWFHVAPIVRGGEKHYVLDPAIEPARPLLLEEWLQRMGNPDRMKVAICDSGTYAPLSNCYKDTDGLELTAEREQRYFLNLERSRILSLGRDPVQELGEEPPWNQ